MAGITGQATTYNLPNFVGPLFYASPTETPFLSAIGGLTGGKSTTAQTIQWQGVDLRSSTANNAALEGAAAPAAQSRVRFNVTNVVERHQSTIEVSYSKLAATGQYSGANIAGVNPVQDELAFQTDLELKAMAIDIEASFLYGAKHVAADNTTANATGGLLTSLSTNVIDAASASLSKALVDELVLSTFQNGGLSSVDSAVIMVSPKQKQALTSAYLTAGNYREQSRSIAGVNYTTIDTDFGTLAVVTNRRMAAGDLAVVSLDECAPVFLEIPGKGFLFVEPLGKVGSSERFQLYGEVGLEYGNEKHHGWIKNLA